MTRDLSCTYDASPAAGCAGCEICGDRLVVAGPTVMDRGIPAPVQQTEADRPPPHRGKCLPQWQCSVAGPCGASQ